MARTDMSRQAVTVRLIRTAQLRRLCLALRRSPREDRPSAGRAPAQPPGAKRSA
jgi:hypothetical protein